MNGAAPAEAVGLHPDRAEAERFLLALVGSLDTPVTFQTYTDPVEWRDAKANKGIPWPLGSKGLPVDPLADWKHGTLAQRWKWLVSMNAAGAGIFVMVNEGDGKGRRTENVTALRALFLDDDTGTLTLDALEFPPSIVLRSRHGLHAYWCLRPGEPLAAFEAAQRQLAAALRTDPVIHDLPRVMRLPGFVHQKEHADRFLVAVVQANDSRFTIAEVLAGHGLAAEPQPGTDTNSKTRAHSSPTATGTADGDPLDAAAIDRGRRFLSGQPQAVQDALGDNLTYRIVAHLLRDLAVPQREAMVVLLEWDAGNSGPWGEVGLREKIARVLKYGKHDFGAGQAKANRGGAPPPNSERSRTAKEAGPVFLPVDDFFATCGQRVEYILEPYIPKDGFVIVGGAPKHGKTWFLGWLAGEVSAAGKTVMFVEEEGSKETLRERLQPFKQAGAKVHVAHRRGFKLDNALSVELLIAEAKAAHADMIILDPLNQLHAHSRQIGDVPAEVIQAIQWIIRETGCAVVLAHHTRKGESWNTASTEEAQSADLAGSFAWAASADNIIQIKGVPKSERRPGEARFYVENPDTRNGEPFPTRLAVVRVDAHGDLDAITFVEPECVAAKDLRRLILPCAPEPPDFIPQADLIEEAGVGSDRGRSAIKYGLRTGELVRKRGKGGGLQRGKSRTIDMESA